MKLNGINIVQCEIEILRPDLYGTSYAISGLGLSLEARDHGCSEIQRI